MIVASLLDSQSNNLTRPDQLIFSQFLLGFGSAFFLAPAMLAAIGGVIADPRNLVSFSVMFGMSQNLGGCWGPQSSAPSRRREVPFQPAG